MIHIVSDGSESTITNVQDGDSQANAVDIRLNKVLKINDDLFEISNNHKNHRSSTPVEVDADGYYNLDIGAYEVTMENLVGIAEGEGGWVITRSTLNRNGLFLTTGWYDSGYGLDAKTGEFRGGVMAAVLHVTTGKARIKKGTRIGQFLCVQAETLSRYDGDYGNHKDHDKKYQ